MSDGTELIPSEDLGRTRRNFLVAVVLLILTGVVAPKTVHLPAVEADVTLPLPLVLCALLAATLYFYYEFYLEYRLTRVRNSQLLGESTANDRAQTFDAGMLRTAVRLEALQSDVRDSMARFGTALKKLPGDWTHPNRDTMFRTFDANLRRVEAMTEMYEKYNAANAQSDGHDSFVKQLRDELSQVHASLQDVLRQRVVMHEHQEINAGLVEKDRDHFQSLLEAAVAELTFLNTNISQVRDSIYTFQERAFFWKELVMPLCLLASGAGLAILRIVQRGTDGFEPEYWAWAMGLCGPALVFGLTVRARKRQAERRRLAQKFRRYAPQPIADRGAFRG